MIDTLKEWDGKLIEPIYTPGISSSLINKAIQEIGTTPEVRLSKLKRLIDNKSIVRVIEAHNGLTG